MEIFTLCCPLKIINFLLQGCKCLYLGIDDDMEDIGTTGNRSIIRQGSQIFS